MNKLWFVCASIAFGIGCGSDGSGVPADKPLIELSASEAGDVCAHLGDLAGAERTVDCGGGVTVTVGFSSTDQADCTSDLDGVGTTNPSCTATVGQTETCFEALFAQDPCMDLALPGACTVVVACL